MHWPVLLRGCRSRHSPAIRSNLCRSTLQPPKGCRGFAHLGFRRDRSKMNSKRYEANEEFRNGDDADPSCLGRYGAAWRLRRGHCLIWATNFPRISCGMAHLCRLVRCTKVVSYLRYCGHVSRTAAMAVFDPYLKPVVHRSIQDNVDLSGPNRDHGNAAIRDRFKFGRDRARPNAVH